LWFYFFPVADWRTGQQLEEELRLLSLFADDPRAPFSLHQFVQHGQIACGKFPGEWFGPSATAKCIQHLVRQHLHDQLRVYTSGDELEVYEDQVVELATSGGKEE